MTRPTVLLTIVRILVAERGHQSQVLQIHMTHGNFSLVISLPMGRPALMVVQRMLLFKHLLPLERRLQSARLCLFSVLSMRVAKLASSREKSKRTRNLRVFRFMMRHRWSPRVL